MKMIGIYSRSASPCNCLCGDIDWYKPSGSPGQDEWRALQKTGTWWPVENISAYCIRIHVFLVSTMSILLVALPLVPVYNVYTHLINWSIRAFVVLCCALCGVTTTHSCHPFFCGMYIVCMSTAASYTLTSSMKSTDQSSIIKYSMKIHLLSVKQALIIWLLKCNCCYIHCNLSYQEQNWYIIYRDCNFRWYLVKDREFATTSLVIHPFSTRMLLYFQVFFLINSVQKQTIFCRIFIPKTCA